MEPIWGPWGTSKGMSRHQKPRGYQEYSCTAVCKSTARASLHFFDSTPQIHHRHLEKARFFESSFGRATKAYSAEPVFLLVKWRFPQTTFTLGGPYLPFLPPAPKAAKRRPKTDAAIRPAAVGRCSIPVCLWKSMKVNEQSQKTKQKSMKIKKKEINQKHRKSMKIKEKTMEIDGNQRKSQKI